MTPDSSWNPTPAGDINERFAIFFAEKRPFFRKARHLHTPTTVYTRRIVDPLTRKAHWHGGAAPRRRAQRSTERAAGIEVAGEWNRYFDNNANYPSRHKQDFSRARTSLLLGDRTHYDSNRGAGIDGRLRWPTIRVTFQGAHERATGTSVQRSEAHPRGRQRPSERSARTAGASRATNLLGWPAPAA